MCLKLLDEYSLIRSNILSDVGLHCLLRTACPNTLGKYSTSEANYGVTHYSMPLGLEQFNVLSAFYLWSNIFVFYLWSCVFIFYLSPCNFVFYLLSCVFVFYLWPCVFVFYLWF